MPASTLVEKQDGILTITFNRPEALNALDWELSRALQEDLCAAEEDQSVRCVVLRGSRHFMAGGDLKWFAKNLDQPRAPRTSDIGRFIDLAHRSIIAIRRMPKPVIASVRGAAAGFGLSLALACDLIVAADDAVFTLAYINIGTCPDGGSTFALPRSVGAKKAAEIAFLGDRFGAAEAKAWGLVNWVVPSELIDQKTAAVAVQLAAGPTNALGRTKALLQQSFHTSLESQLQSEATSFLACANERNFNEGVSSFVKKRKPLFNTS